MGERGGYPAKDSPILDGFNPEKEGGLGVRELQKLEKQLEVLGANGTAGVAPDEDDDSEDSGLEGLPKTAAEMLQDMRWVYGELGGRKKLKKLLKGDDKHFVFLVKELMKIETAILAAKVRAKEDTGRTGERMVFVVLKGLEEDKKIMKTLESGPNAIDMRQVQRAMTPDGAEFVMNEDDKTEEEPARATSTEGSAEACIEGDIR